MKKLKTELSLLISQNNLLITVITFIFISIILSSCNILNKKEYWQQEDDIIYNKRNSWVYKALSNDISGKVLYFKPPYGADLTWYPAFIIVATESLNSDTIIVLDRKFKGVLKENDNVKIKPDTWNDLELESWGTAYFKGKERKKTYPLLRAVDTVYYGRIK